MKILGVVLVAVVVLACSWSCRSVALPLSASWPTPHPESLERSPVPDAPEREPAASLLTSLRAPSQEDAGYVWPRLSLSIGAQLIADMNTQLRVDSDTLGNGTEIDLENDFDVDNRLFLGRLDANWRMAKKHELEFSVFDLQREGTKVTDRQIQIGDTVFPVNTRVTSEFETLVVKLAYRYAFLYRPRWHVGASFGVHTMDWNMKWQSGNHVLEEDFGVLVPLPVVGVFGSYALTPKLYLNATSEFFGLEYEQFDGFLNNTRLSLEHRTFEHLAFGLGLDYFLINASVESDSGNLSASADYDYLGLLLFARIF